MVRRKVRYTLEVEGELIVIENVPARVCLETGEQFFSPNSVERLQKMVSERTQPSRTMGFGKGRTASTGVPLWHPNAAKARRGA